LPCGSKRPAQACGAVFRSDAGVNKTNLSRLIYYFVITDFIALNEIRIALTANSFNCTEKYCRSSGGIFYSCVAAVALRSADCAARAVNRNAIRGWLVC
jgi:hypothetical protein